jgi:hypothetical protein
MSTGPLRTGKHQLNRNIRHPVLMLDGILFWVARTQLIGATQNEHGQRQCGSSIGLENSGTSRNRASTTLLQFDE